MEACRKADITLTVTGVRNTLERKHFEAMKDGMLIANAGHRENLARARELLNVSANTDDAASTRDEPGTDSTLIESGQPTYVCPDCGAAMIIIETLVCGQPIRAPPSQRGAA